MQRDWQIIAAKLQADPSGLIPLREAAGLLRCTPSAAYRWILNGKDGVALEACYVGRGWMTTREAVGRFVGEVSRRAAGDDAQAPAVPDASREKRAKRAVEELGRLMGRPIRRAPV